MGANPQRRRTAQDERLHLTPKSEPKKPVKRVAKKSWIERIVWKKLVVSLVFVYVVVHLVGGCFTIMDLKQQEADIASQLAAVKTEQMTLEAQVTYMNSDETVEKLAREKLGLIKPGEIVVVRADDANKEQE